MIVQCIANDSRLVPANRVMQHDGLLGDTIYPLTVGSQYLVYAITIDEGHLWYYVLDDDELSYPVWKSAEFFNVIDPSMPDCWIMNYVRPKAGKEGHPIIAFPEWALDRFYYERLVDGEPEAVAVFAKRKQEIEGGASQLETEAPE